MKTSQRESCFWCDEMSTKCGDLAADCSDVRERENEKIKFRVCGIDNDFLISYIDMGNFDNFNRLCFGLVELCKSDNVSSFKITSNSRLKIPLSRSIVQCSALSVLSRLHNVFEIPPNPSQSTCTL